MGPLRWIATAIVLSNASLAHAALQAQRDHALDDLPRPCHLVLADFNQDGQTDLAVSCWSPGEDASGGSVQIFWQKNGRFAGQPDRQLKVTRPWGLLAADFDGDGKTDLAVKDTGKKLHLFLGKEDFAVDHVSPNVNDCDRTVNAGRLSPRGLVDFLSGPVWRKWTGGDQFLSGYCRGPTANDNRLSVMADLNHDGHTDIVFGAGSEIRLYYGPLTTMDVRADEVGQLVTIRTPQPVQSLAVADVNGDGRPDLIAGLRESRNRSVAIWCQRAPMDFDVEAAPDAVLVGAGGGVHTADLNRDGLADLIVPDGVGERIFVFLQRKGRPLPDAIDQASQVLRVRHTAIAVGDLNGDGLPDLAVADGRSKVNFFLNDGKDAALQVATRPKALQAPLSRSTGEGQGVRAAHLQKSGSLNLPHSTLPPNSSPDQPSVGGQREKGTPDKSLQPEPPAIALPPPRPGADYDDPGRMPFYTGTILPTPQQVTYRDEYFSLDRAALVVGPDVEADGPHVAELRQRVERYGGRLTRGDVPSDSSGTLILLGNVPAAGTYLQGAAVPQREQGYLMLCRTVGQRKAVVLQGHDRLGLLWAIASFNQLVHERDGRPVVRAADVIDYPATPHRGFIAGHWPEGTSYCVAFKINKPVFQSALADPSIADRTKRAGAWRNPLPDAVRRDLQTYGQRLSPLGIAWYAGVNPIVGPEKIRSANEEDFQAILQQACAVAEAGGNLCLKYDDQRFPISPDDLKQFGTAREADVHFLTRLHTELVKRHPRARILFCPPFYWGPNSTAIYPEPRDDYLYALGKRLPKEIEIFWTGPSVKSGVVTPAMVDWITQRIGRKPVYWQNGFGSPHAYLYHYVTDPVPVYRDWFYKDFLQQIDCYMLNCSMPAYAAAVATCADFCWNPQTYDAERSIREAATKLVGADTYPALVSLNRSLSWFDPFGLRRTPGAAQKLPEMAQRLAAVKSAWGEVQRRNARAVQAWTGMQRHVDQVDKFYQHLQHSPNLAAYRDEAAASLKQAVQEVRFSDKENQFLSAYDFTGGVGPKHYALNCEKRLATWIYGGQSPNRSMESQFAVEPFPPSSDYELIVSAQDDDAEAVCRIRIWVNDTKIFEGPNPFPAHAWSRHTFRIPAASLHRSSRLRIENAEDAGRTGGPPFFMLNYAVVRQARR